MPYPTTTAAEVAFFAEHAWIAIEDAIDPVDKPPQTGARTYWHQDEAYRGRAVADQALTGWMPLHDVDTRNGCTDEWRRILTQHLRAVGAPGEGDLHPWKVS